MSIKQFSCYKLEGELDNKEEITVRWTKTTFERQQLFDEVWATPVTKLAKAYGLSDVGLRKICVALDVPLPPRGYSAKLAAGKTIPKPALHETTVKTTYARAMYVVEVDDVLEVRVAKARDAAPYATSPDTPDYSPPLDTKDFSPQAKLVRRVLKSTEIDEGAFSSVGVTWADISVSKNLTERALLLVDRFAHELEVLGAKFENTHPPLSPLRRGAGRDSGRKRNCFMYHGQRFFVRIQERVTQELVPPPPPKPLRPGARQPEWKYRPQEYRYTATGKLHAAVVDAATYYVSSKSKTPSARPLRTKSKGQFNRSQTPPFVAMWKLICEQSANWSVAVRPGSGRQQSRIRTSCWRLLPYSKK